jgi:hypothetical protein
MARLIGVLMFASGLLAACLGRATVPFAITRDVDQALAGWRDADTSCGQPQIGWPGPAADWQCAARLAGADVRMRLIADRFGVQSIHVGVGSATARADAAHAFAAVVEATPPLDAASAHVVEWLLANDAADGEMPLPSPADIGRVAVDSTEPGVTMLYVIPLGSSMLAAGTQPP